MDIETMIARYAKGESTESLSRAAGVSRQTISNRLIKAGVELRSSGGTLTPSQGRAVAEAYSAGESSTMLATRFGITNDAVLMCCRRYGVTVRSRADYPSTRQHHFREDLFATWSPDMAYILGLIATDGNVCRGCLRIYQKETALLDQVRKAFEAEVEYDKCGSKTNPIPTLRLHSNRLVSDLLALGVHSNKSRTIRAPVEVPFPADYVRGIFDGDGHGNFYMKRGQPQLRIGFTSGSKGFLEDIQALLPEPIGGPYENRGCYSLQTTSEKHAQAIRDWMYSGRSGIHSARKRNKLYGE